jgi:alpha-tubulin suppressor-like RCC1 family protein
VFVKTDNTLWAMGNNNYGQLGDGSTTQQPTPVQIATDVSQAHGGAIHTVFIKTDNTVWSMGYNGYSQLGDNTTTNRSTPAQFDVNVTAIATGGYHTLAITLP